jgi:fatty-acyl-CoA synthase
MDPQGRYRIVGRKKEMIITGGENVYPGEVINALLGHPAVAEAAVFGVPSERWGEEVQAVVYLAPECAVAPTSEELAGTLPEPDRRVQVSEAHRNIATSPAQDGRG